MNCTYCDEDAAGGIKLKGVTRVEGETIVAAFRAVCGDCVIRAFDRALRPTQTIAPEATK